MDIINLWHITSCGGGDSGLKGYLVDRSWYINGIVP